MDEIAQSNQYWGWERYNCVAPWSGPPGGQRETLGWLFVVFSENFHVYNNKLTVQGIYFQDHRKEDRRANGKNGTDLVFTGTREEIIAEWKRFLALVNPGAPHQWGNDRPTCQTMWQQVNNMK